MFRLGGVVVAVLLRGCYIAVAATGLAGVSFLLFKGRAAFRATAGLSSLDSTTVAVVVVLFSVHPGAFCATISGIASNGIPAAYSIICHFKVLRSFCATGHGAPSIALAKMK